MRRQIISTAAVVLLLLGATAGCSRQTQDAPGAVTPEEAAQLNDAAAMLDANSMDANQIDPDRADHANESSGS